ncbi:MULTISPECIES: NAD(+) synthase [Bacteroides]|mgnify:FL=1|jgi:NAD+ synthase (glutamine-hydrolysing)|uniref:Glutamine-dependent NAD(+) synthetase n=1 Tax=Bacteroides nordii CL02T12C05 TaxID=997884 RepID=I9GYV1_9BACE|nr:NAD(+) synthase [Bacteroides nordii]EIY52304.1 NAD+ synthetase [Bacteroides nordii CL02T12C05]MCE8466113.1 NAD(+) synthase [Bacteroides nordii]MCG4768674.1 NAD(+) synthase [Bacteroides nordii]MCQ4915245.1 NAD(+) synthase [Bacteroides nordii]UYU47758.1 NAD(+) synthase [Bacteroides nordii]
MNYGFVKVAAAVPRVKIADCNFNAKQLESLIAVADGKGVQIITFPEMCITAYTCGDLFGQQLLLEEAEMALMQILNNTRQLDIISILGMPVIVNSTVINAAVVIQKGKVLGVVPKTYLPNYKEFYEQRWFTSALQIAETSVRLCGQIIPMGTNLLFETSDTIFGIEICEDLWSTIPPSSTLALQGAEIIFNLSADNEGIGKNSYLRSLISQQSARCISGYVFSSCGFGESTTDVVFAGNGLIYENGNQLAHNDRFSFEEQLIISEIDVEYLRAERRINTTFAASKGNIPADKKPVRIATEFVNSKELNLTRTFKRHPFVPQGAALNERCEEVFSIQVAGLAQRLVHTGAKTAVIGISGGLDSTLALLVCVKTFDKLGLSRKNIIGVTMPGFGTTNRTYHNAISLMNSLGITLREISIKEACIQHFKDINHDINVHDVTYENAQARERTQILMDIANQTGGMVIGTGDLSELALGWATYNGDHMSMYGVNGSIPKTLVKYLVKWVAENEVDETSCITLLDIVDTPISPELIPADENGDIKQKTEDLVGPYELHDFFLYYFMRFGFRPSKIFMLASLAFKEVYDEETIKKWLLIFFRRFFNQQFKRSCLPDGPKVGSISISPRGDWRMPSDASAAAWLKEIEKE